MLTVGRVKLIVFVLFLGGGLALLLAGALAGERVHAYSAGPPAGFTNAPGEFNCAECHLPPDSPNAGTGQLSIDAPADYIPGQTYQITVTQANADQTRQRWGFQLTALDASNTRAGTLASVDALTQVLTDQGPGGARQYVEHTLAGTFAGQKNNASWTFNWTAPATDVGAVTFYAAGNQANNDGNTSGDLVYHNFRTSTPAGFFSTFAISADPSARSVTPGNSASYTITLGSLDGFSGQVTLSASGLPAGAQATFTPNPVSVNTLSTSTLNLTTAANTPHGSYTITIKGTSGDLVRTTTVMLHVVSPSSADLSVTKTDSPDPAAVRTNLSYRITVTNNGPAAATGISLTDTLAAGATFVSVAPSQGACSGTSNITCALGNLNAGESAVVTLNVQPQAVGSLTNTASVTASETDPIAANNSATTTTSVQAQGTAPSMTVPELGVRSVVGGLNQPTSLAFTGANEFLVLEKATGKVLVVRNGRVQGEAIDLAVNNASERGLLGIALHPNFAANRLVYLYWTWRGTGTGADNLLGADTSDTTEVPLLGNRVDRFVWNNSTLTFDRNITRLRALQADADQPPRGNHNGGVLRFGADGKLYIVIGDEGRRGHTQNIASTSPDDQFGGPSPDDAHLTGVILRLNDDGSTPSDNPFFNANAGYTGEAAANVRKVFAYGVRNSFGMAFDPLSGKLWTQENGDDSFDEINLVEAGFNGGWIQFMGPSTRLAEYRSIEISRAGGLQQVRWPSTFLAQTREEALARLINWPGARYVEPQFSWKYAVAPSPIGFAGNALGRSYAGDLFVGASRTTLLGGYLFRFKLSEDRQSLRFSDGHLIDRVADNADKFDLTESESLVVGRDFGITTDIQTAPDGTLYVVSLSQGAIYQVFAQPRLFIARLAGAQNVPPSQSTVRATATILLQPDETTARVSLHDYCCLAEGQQAAVHLHGAAPAGETAPVLFTLPTLTAANSGFSDFQITLTSQQVAHLKAGLLYVDVHPNAATGDIRGQFGGTPAAAPSLFEFETNAYRKGENRSHETVRVRRLGDASAPATVDFATSDGTASERADYTTLRTTLHFAAGEREKTLSIFLTDDAFVEPEETLNLTLSNPTGATALSPNRTATLTILDSEGEQANAPNPITDARFFVRQHYIDFLNRAPDAEGFNFWTNQIEECGANAGCREVRRINVSAAFFLSIEFQETGYFVYRLYETSFDRPPRFYEFMHDADEVRRGVVVNVGDWQTQLENNKRAFLDAWVNTAAFKVEYGALTNAQFVARLLSRAGITLGAAEENGLVADLAEGRKSRAEVLRYIADHPLVRAGEKNRAFVLMQYFGYLRRNPDDAPDGNLAGYNFWLGKLNAHGGDYISAEMVKAFITSGEYLARFGQ